MRASCGLLGAVTLSACLAVSCGESNGAGGTGGSGGTGGTGGIGGTGGADLCEGVSCEDTECKIDGVCDANDGMCDYTFLGDGTACEEGNECSTGMCGGGTCVPVADGTACGDDAGTCQQGSCQVACTEEGIRDAIAAGGGPFTFDCDGPTTVVTQAEIIIDHDVILDGEGNLTVDGDEDHRVFSVPEGVTAELREFRVTNGAAEEGGGIYNHGTLTLINSTVSDNSATGWSNGFSYYYGVGGGVYNLGRLTLLSDSAVSENSADSSGGGIHNGYAASLTLANSTVSENSAESGGGIDNGGTLTLTNSTVSGNSANSSGGIRTFGMAILTNSTVSENSASGWNGGGIYSGGTLTLTDSTVSGNSAGWIGGGIHNEWSGTLTLTNSTVSGNSAKSGGGIRNESLATLTLTNSTVSGNRADEGGGIQAFGGGTLTLTNSTVSGSFVAGCEFCGPVPVTIAASVIDGACSSIMMSGIWNSNGHNLESPGNTCGFDQPTDQVNVTAEQLALGPLADNGGPTMTHALLLGSVAIDQIPEEDCLDADGEPLITDQRGEPRPETGGTLCDVGAFEVQP